MRISDWSSDVCSSDLGHVPFPARLVGLLCLGGRGGGMPALGALDEPEVEQAVLQHRVDAAVGTGVGVGAQIRLRRVPEFLLARGDERHNRVAHLLRICVDFVGDDRRCRSEEHTSELQSLMRISYAVFCLKKKKTTNIKSKP